MEWEWLSKTVGLYRDEAHPLTEDPLHLMRFCSVTEKDRVLDLGCGTGVLSFLSAERGATVLGIDLDAAAILLANDAAKRNGLSVRFQSMDVTEAPKALAHGSFTHILMNPPYFPDGARGKSELFRHGNEASLSDWCRAAFLLLENRGKLSLCYPADQLAPLFRALDENRLSPKRLQFLSHQGKAWLVLLEARKLGKDGLTVLV